MALKKILVVGKDSNMHQLAQPFTSELFSADEPNDVLDMTNSVEPELIILDPTVTSEQICDCIKKLQDRSFDTPVVVINSKEKSQIEHLIGSGLFDCIDTTEDPAILGKTIDRIAQSSFNLPSEHQRFFLDQCPRNVSIVGKSKAIIKSLKMINLVAKSSCNPILIIGETGTGKELAAKAVHVLRHGSDSKFVAVNCAALTANLLESELFGHVKGSFTSADREKTGLLELAGTGSIFLDEISEMPLELQAKLLRVLQEKNFKKVGGTKDIECKATIIASSNRNLFSDVQQGKFRADLYYRLTICPIMLAPLRAESRKEDILLLAEYFIKNSQICPDKAGKIKGLTALAAENLKKHHWPGNIRELKNVLDRAIMLESSDMIGTSNLIIHPEQQHDYNSKAGSGPGIKDFSLEKAEKELVARALAEAGWQKTRAAALLGITRATLYAKVKQYDIKEPSEQVAVPS